MIIELIIIVICELMVLLGILIVYWAEYTNSYIHCHKPTEPCYDKIKVVDYYCPKGMNCNDSHHYDDVCKSLDNPEQWEKYKGAFEND